MGLVGWIKLSPNNNNARVLYSWQTNAQAQNV
jgi:hypothetical protein